MTPLTNQKKWFIYAKDHHEGPFTPLQIDKKRKEGEVNLDTFVWSDGMTDWTPLREIQVLKQILSSLEHPGSIAETDGIALLPELELELDAVDSVPATPSMNLALNRPAELPTVLKGNLKTGYELDSIPTVELIDPPERERSGVPPPGGGKLRGIFLGSIFQWILRFFRVFFRLARWAAFLGVMVYIAQAASRGKLDPLLESPTAKRLIELGQTKIMPWVAEVVSENPMALRKLSKIPDLPGLDPIALRTLRLACLPPHGGKKTPTLEIAVASPDFQPILYLTTNLPDGAQFEIVVEGLTETLLNSLSANSHIILTAVQHFGQTPLRLPSGNPLPTGSYQIRVTESFDQPGPVKAILDEAIPSNAREGGGKKLLVVRTLFIGQPKGAPYEAALKDFHARIRAQALQELDELRQSTQSMELRLAEAARVKSRSERSKSLSKSLKEDEHLSAEISRWSVEEFRAKSYYGVLYLSAVQAAQTILDYDEIEKRRVKGDGNAASLEIQRGEALSVAQTTVLNLRSKVDLAERTMATGELPPREGL